MRIGELSKLVNISAESIRHYEKLGLIKEAIRSDSGQRYYVEGHITQLKSILHLRRLKFSLKEIEQLFNYQHHSENYTRQEIKHFVNKHLSEVDELLNSLLKVKQELNQLVELCDGSNIQAKDCPILNGLRFK